MLRRGFLQAMAAFAASPALAKGDWPSEPGLQLGAAKPFRPEDVLAEARRRAARPYKMRPRIPADWTSISYDQYRKIWFDVRNALWVRDRDVPLELDVFAPGLYFPHPISIEVVEGAETRPVSFDMAVFDTTDQFPDLPVDGTLGYSGLRLRGDLRGDGIFNEFTVFQGASYFRAIGTGDIYGLSARGLAIDTGEPRGEEFPEFVAFWLEKPDTGDDTFILHALLDSPSCTGAYRFAITPGQPLVMEVEATVIARDAMRHVGLAPLTSMFQYDQTNRDRFSDFRPAVHDSDGLQIVNGAGETIWRPLANPQNLQISAFVDRNPQGFGLMQRARKFSDFNDLEAHYHRRPGLWVEPRGDWGQGSVVLVEIPTDKEIYDNIVAYWRPAGTWKRGEERRFDYGLTWGDDAGYGKGLKVLNTAMGAGFGGDGIVAVIDFEAGPQVPEDLDQVVKLVRGSAGEVSAGVLQRNPETGGPRLAFKFHPMDAKLIEFRAGLWLDGAPLTETWLYRWTA